MKNLAGVKDCDVYIREELTKARINVVPCELTHSEVPYRLIGKLGEFEFWRAWYYWVVTGPMPLELAKELYEDPVGKVDIRVDGHCGCPPPEDPWLKYIDADGFKLVRESERKEFEEAFEGRLPEILSTQKIRFSDDRARDGKAFVECYHIDTMAGLRLFADTIHNRLIGSEELI